MERCRCWNNAGIFWHETGRHSVCQNVTNAYHGHGVEAAGLLAPLSAHADLVRLGRGSNTARKGRRSMLEDLLRRKPYNAAADFVDAPVARGFGKKIAFIDPDHSLTYAELQERT